MIHPDSDPNETEATGPSPLTEELPEPMEGTPEEARGEAADEAAPQPDELRKIAAKVEALERQMESAGNRTRLLGRVQSMLEWVPKAEIPEITETPETPETAGETEGGLDSLVERLKRLEALGHEQLQENLRQKEALCERAEAFADSTDWNATAEAIKALQAEWKTIGPVPKERSDEVWGRFRAPANQFFERRKEHLDTADKELKENLQKKIALCEQAEALSTSTDWKATAEALKALQTEWKTIGPVPQSKTNAVWHRFRRAANQFFERRKEHFDQRDGEHQTNLERKTALCVRAEELSTSSEWKVTAEAIKALQAEWKTLGPVLPKEQGDAIWARFRAAIDHFFARQAAWFDERGQRQSDWRNQMREALARKREQVDRLRESIQRDEENLDRWRASLAAVRPGAREEEIRTNLETKIGDVELKYAGKRERLTELESSIRDIEAKL
jgi:phage repressor protein C with HTH and peptisase S24 domain